MTHDQEMRDLLGADYPRALRIRDGYHTPDDRKAFWDGLRETKRANPAFRLADAFPVGHMPEVAPAPVSMPSVPERPNDRLAIARKACGEILEMLRKPKRKEGA